MLHLVLHTEINISKENNEWCPEMEVEDVPLPQSEGHFL